MFLYHFFNLFLQQYDWLSNNGSFKIFQHFINTEMVVIHPKKKKNLLYKFVY